MRMRRFIFLAAAFYLSAISSVAQPREIVVDPSVTCQTIDGFGASDAWSMRFIGEMPADVRDRVARLLFSRETDAKGKPLGVGMSIWRFNIGAGSVEQGDSSLINHGTRTECFLNADGSYNWDRQLGQRRFLRLARDHGVETVVGFLNSPPVFFTQNGLATNTGRSGDSYNLRDDRYGDFAVFLADVTDSLLARDGIRIDYLSPVNEPDGHWNWLGPKQEGTPARNAEIARLARTLDSELARRNSDVKIIIPESSDYRCMLATHMTDSARGYEIEQFFSGRYPQTDLGGLSRLPRLMAGHSYWTNTPVDSMRIIREKLRDVMKKNGVGFWQSEVCIMANDEEIGGGGHYDRTMMTALYVARLIHHDLAHADARTWQWWRAVGGDYKDGLLFQYREPGEDTDTIVDSKLLWAFGNYSRFIRPGARRVKVSEAGSSGTAVTDPRGLMVSSYLNPDGSLVTVVINYSGLWQRTSFGFGGEFGDWRVYRTSDVEGENLLPVAVPRGVGRMQFPPRSVTTIVGSPKTI